MNAATLPAWVCWLAQDADGVWWGYEVEPLQRDHGWYENELGRQMRLQQEAVNPDWAETLRQVERGKRFT